MKYELLSAAAPFLLQTLVNERLSEGWQLFGSPFAAASGKIAKSARGRNVLPGGDLQ